MNVQMDENYKDDNRWKSIWQTSSS